MTQEDSVMNNQQKDRKAAGKPRDSRLSPELDEFVHMMKALESQFGGQPPNSADNE